MPGLFDLHNNGTDLNTEFLAGLTSFLASMYVIVLNPSILQQTGMPFNGVLTATVIISAFSSIMMGMYAKNPIIIAPGMGINHLFVYVIVKTENVPWETALGCIFWAGIFFLILTLCDRNKFIVNGVPRVLRFGIAAGIGLFIALIGFESAGFIEPDPVGGIWGWGKINIITITFIIGLLFTAILIVKKVKGSLILGIFFTTILSWPIGRTWGETTLLNWTGLWSAPDFSLLFKLDIIGSLRLSLWPIIFVFLFTCLFDSLATCVGVCEAGNLIDEEGDPRNIKKSMVADAAGVLASSLIGTSPATCYIESATGVKEGGRTGLTSVIAGLLFLPFLFLSPLLSLVPSIATAPVLVLAGVFMLKPLVYVRWERYDEVIPFFMSMLLIPLTYSITQGIIWGCISWSFLKAAQGKWRQVPLMLWITDILSLLFLMDVHHFKI